MASRTASATRSARAAASRRKRGRAGIGDRMEIERHPDAITRNIWRRFEEPLHEGVDRSDAHFGTCRETLVDTVEKLVARWMKRARRYARASRLDAADALPV